MDKRDIIGLFLKNGIMLSPEEFEAVDEKNYMQLLKKMSGEKNDGEIEIATPKTGRISCDQFIKICGGKFEFLKSEILKKTEAVSINKGKKLFAEATIVGRAKETTSGGFIIEDITGETEVVTENRDVNAGDVVGLKGFFRENRFFPNQVIWPDIPLDNQPRPFSSRIMLTTKITEGMSGLIVCPGPETETGRQSNVLTGFDRYGTVKISRHQSRFMVIAYNPRDEIREDAAVKMLKKRTIADESIVDNAITEVPGILWLFGNKRDWAKNYRGVLIISTSDGSFAEYDGGEVTFGSLDG
jgi:hypothetical protein